MRQRSPRSESIALVAAKFPTLPKDEADRIMELSECVHKSKSQRDMAAPRSPNCRRSSKAVPGRSPSRRDFAESRRSPRVQAQRDAAEKSVTTRDISSAGVISSGEESVRDVYQQRASTFFEEMKAWFEKEMKTMQANAERKLAGPERKLPGLEDSELVVLLDRVEQLEATVGMLRANPANAGDAAAGTSDGQAVDAAMLALCREEASRTCTRLCTDLAEGSSLRCAVQQCVAEEVGTCQRSFQAEIEELRAALVQVELRAALMPAESHVPAGAVTAELGRLDGALRASLAAEVRDLGCMCEGARARIEAVDHTAAAHISRLDQRLDRLELVHTSQVPGLDQSQADSIACLQMGKEEMSSLLDCSNVGSLSGIAPFAEAPSDLYLQRLTPSQDQTTQLTSAPAPACVPSPGLGNSASEILRAPDIPDVSTPPKRHVPPAAALPLSPREKLLGSAGSKIQWMSLSPRTPGRGGC